MELRDPTELGQTRASLTIDVDDTEMLGLASSKWEGLFSTRSQLNKSIILSVLRYSLNTSTWNDHWHNYCSRLMYSVLKLQIT